MSGEPSVVAVEVVSVEEGVALFDAACQEYDIPAAEFLDAYDSGKAWGRWEHDAVAHLSMLIPFAR